MAKVTLELLAPISNGVETQSSRSHGLILPIEANASASAAVLFFSFSLVSQSPSLFVRFSSRCGKLREGLGGVRHVGFFYSFIKK